MAASRETLRLLDGMRIQLDAKVDAAVRDLVLAWAAGWSEIAAEWDDAIADLVAASQGGKWPSRRALMRAERALSALQVTRAALEDLAEDFGVRILQDVPLIVGDAARWEAELLSSQMPREARTYGLGGVQYDAARFNRVDPAALDAIVERTTNRVTTLAGRIPDPAYRAIKATLIKGVAVGDNPRRTAATMRARVRDQFDLSLYRALVITRTEMVDAHRASQYGQDLSNRDTVASWQWVAKLDARTCRSCWAQHGKVHDVLDPGPLDHQQGRCARVPVAKPWAELGFDMIEPVSVLPDARLTFANLSRAEQVAIMGEKPLTMLERGQIGWDDLSRRRVTTGWRDSFAPASMRELLRLVNRRAS